MHFEGICGLKTELNYPFNKTLIHNSNNNITDNYKLAYKLLLNKTYFKLALKDYRWGLTNNNW